MQSRLVSAIFPLRFPAPLSSVGSFATTNNMSINVHGVDDDKKVIYPLPFFIQTRSR